PRSHRSHLRWDRSGCWSAAWERRSERVGRRARWRRSGGERSQCAYSIFTPFRALCHVCSRIPAPVISFGTDGWRAVIADGFTFDNVRRVTNAVGVAARSLEPPPDVDRNALAVGYDRRFLSREFAEV